MDLRDSVLRGGVNHGGNGSVTSVRKYKNDRQIKQYNESNWMAGHFMPFAVEFIVLNNTIYTATYLHSESLKVM